MEVVVFPLAQYYTTAPETLYISWDFLGHLA